MSLVDDYPKMHRNETVRLRALLNTVSGLSQKDREDVAMAINDLADKAHDLNEIFERLVRGEHNRDALADLLIAFELTTEQIRGASDILDGKLYEIGDALKRTAAEATE